MIARATKPQVILAAILLVQALLGVTYAAATPLWHDHEPDFYAVTRFVVENGRLPSAEDYPANDAEIRQATQPPLYFLLAYPVVALLDDDQRVPPGNQPALICVGDGGANATVIDYPITTEYFPPISGAVAGGYGLRLLNLLLGIAATILTYRAGRILFPTRPTIALIAAGLMAFEGNLIRLYTEIGNDALLVSLSAAHVLVCAHLAKRLTRRMTALLMVTAGLALLTRLQGWALLAFDIPFILLVSLIQSRAPLSRRLRRVLILAGVLALVAAAVVIFNLLTYGSVLGRYSSLGGAISTAFENFRLPGVTIAGVASLTYSAYLEPLRELSPRAAFVTAYGALLLVGMLSSVWLLVSASYQRDRSRVGALLILFGTAGIAALLVLFRNALTADADNTTLYNTSGVYAPIRYYAPGLPAFALLLAAGLTMLIPERLAGRLRNLPGTGVAGCWLLVSALGGAVLMLSRPAPTILSPAEFASAPGLTIVEDGQSSNAPHLLAYQVTERPEDGIAVLTLYLTADTALSLNYYAQVELVTADGQRVSRCEFLPARGAYPTSLWQPEQIVQATAVLPMCGENTALAPQLTLRWIGARRNGAVATQPSEPVTLAQLGAGYRQAAGCPDNLGVVAGVYQVVKFNSPPTIRPNEIYLPSVNWLVFDPDSRADSRVFAFTHTASGTEYTCEGSLAPRVYNVANWRHGDQIFFDTCRVIFPTDAPPGLYQVAVGIAGADGSRLEASTASGDPFPDGFIPVGTVELVS